MKLIIELTESELAKLEEVTKTSFYGSDIDADVSDAVSKLITSSVPKKVGKWIEVEDNPDEYHYECSECGQRMNWLDEYDHYCCNCGSKNWEG
jgi:hypothetical protein